MHPGVCVCVGGGGTRRTREADRGGRGKAERSYPFLVKPSTFHSSGTMNTYEEAKRILAELSLENIALRRQVNRLETASKKEEPDADAEDEEQTKATAWDLSGLERRRTL